MSGIQIGDHAGVKGLEIRQRFAWRAEGGKAVYRFQWRYGCSRFYAESAQSFATEQEARTDFTETLQAVVREQ